MAIARSTYYDRSEKATDDTAIVEAMFAINDEFEFYGYRRVGAALRQQGLVVNHKKIRRLMREHDLQPRIRRRARHRHVGQRFTRLAGARRSAKQDRRRARRRGLRRER